ncbi:RidA family protein [Pseudarthrobacter sp. CC4]|uniref:RidA family protein n=1 Tax=Pseudarthrobacter sp. CC4 TaxID=3029190 RepID=UPI003B8D056C
MTPPIKRAEVLSVDVPSPRGHFSHAVIAGNLVHVSGLLGFDASGQLPEPGDIEAQTARILDSLESILLAAGSSPAFLVKLTVYVTDISERSAVNRLRADRWPDTKPASTLVEVSDLAAEGAVIEIDAVAVR